MSLRIKFTLAQDSIVLGYSVNSYDLKIVKEALATQSQ